MRGEGGEGKGRFALVIWNSSKTLYTGKEKGGVVELVCIAQGLLDMSKSITLQNVAQN